MTVTSQDIYNLIHQGESASVEFKKCSDSVPRSVWETYSAFANTRGGVILLGIIDIHNPRQGIDNPGQVKGQANPILGQVMGQVAWLDIRHDVPDKIGI